MDIVYNSLKFLVDDYGFRYQKSILNQEIVYKFEGTEGSFIYQEFLQYCEEYFYIEKGRNKELINVQEFLNSYNLSKVDYPKEERKGFKSVFKKRESRNIRLQERWNAISEIIKHQIEETGSFFGLKVNTVKRNTI